MKEWLLSNRVTKIANYVWKKKPEQFWENIKNKWNVDGILQGTLRLAAGIFFETCTLNVENSKTCGKAELPNWIA